jgi:hypothetical protein
MSAAGIMCCCAGMFAVMTGADKPIVLQLFLLLLATALTWYYMLVTPFSYLVFCELDVTFV